MHYRTPVIGGRFSNILYCLLNNHVHWMRTGAECMYVNSRRYNRNVIPRAVVEAFGLGGVYDANESGSVPDSAIEFVFEDPRSICFAGFGFDFTSSELESFIRSVLLPSGRFGGLVGDRVGVHIRGGDYLAGGNSAQFGFRSFGYLEAALERMAGLGVREADVYSDDFMHAREYAGVFRAAGFSVNWMEGGSMEGDFAGLSCHRRRILWNSTWSYWTAYIGNVLFGDNHSEVIAPWFHVSWFNGGAAHQLDPRWTVLR